MNSGLEFAELWDRCIGFLNDRKFISVATSYRDQVRSRVVDYVNDGLQILNPQSNLLTGKENTS